MSLVTNYVQMVLLTYMYQSESATNMQSILQVQAFRLQIYMAFPIAIARQEILLKNTAGW